MWADEATIEEAAIKQLRNVSTLPWTHGLRVMPDVHYGKGATVGSVIAMHQAVAPAAVGVDIGCGMTAVRTNLRPDQLPDDLARLRRTIERGVPVGSGAHADRSPSIDRHGELKRRFREMREGFESLQAHRLARSFWKFQPKAVS
jgi:rtcB protein